MKDSLRSQRGIGLVETIIALGVLAVISAAMIGLMSNLFKSTGAALKSSNRIDGMRAVATALSSKATCTEALGSGSLTVPEGWTAPPASGPSTAITLPPLVVGGTTLAGTGQVLPSKDIRVTGIKLEYVAGPETVKTNVAAPADPPDIKDYRRYLGRIKISLEKVGNAKDNVGGTGFKDSEFVISLLVNDSNRLIECFSATNTSALAGGASAGDAVIDELCEGAFEGTFNAALFPWCTINRMAVGTHVNGPYPGGLTLPAGTGRLIVAEQQYPTNPNWDSTVLLHGQTGGNGPGIHWHAPNPGLRGALGIANQNGRYGSHTKAGDMAWTTLGGNIHLVPLTPADVASSNARSVLTARNDGIVIVGDVTKATATWKSNNALNRGVISTFSEDDNRWVAMGSNTVALNEYGMVFGKGDTATSKTGAFFHSATALRQVTAMASYGNNDLLLFTDPAHNGVWGANLILRADTGFIGIHEGNPTVKLHIGSDAKINGKLDVANIQPAGGGLTLTGNVSVTGTITASSDVRLKKDIHLLEDSLVKILALRGI